MPQVSTIDQPHIDSLTMDMSFSAYNVVGSSSISLRVNFTLHEVLHIPSFHVNLLYISSLIVKSNYVVMFCANTFLIEDLQMLKVISKGRLSQGLNLYEVDPSYSKSNKSYIHETIVCKFVDSKVIHL
ncbi:hypothetical protein CR513_58556, partial [Mucuna pruriens]